jgi:hypothetical protein
MMMTEAVGPGEDLRGRFVLMNEDDSEIVGALHEKDSRRDGLLCPKTNSGLPPLAAPYFYFNTSMANTTVRGAQAIHGQNPQVI